MNIVNTMRRQEMIDKDTQTNVHRQSTKGQEREEIEGTSTTKESEGCEIEMFEVS